MATQQITRDCSVRIPREFRRRVKGTDLCLYAPGRTVWIAAYSARHLDPAKSVQEACAPDGKPEEEWERRENDVFGRAWLQPAPPPAKHRYSILSVTSSPRTLILMGFTFDEERDVEWAIHTWNSLKFRRRAPRRRR